MSRSIACGNHGIQYALFLPLIVAGIIFMILTGCTKTVTVPGPAVEVKVPVPVACEIEQVPASERLKAPKGAGIHALTKTALADRRKLMAENQRLRAANNNPCPAR